MFLFNEKIMSHKTPKQVSFRRHVTSLRLKVLLFFKKCKQILHVVLCQVLKDKIFGKLSKEFIKILSSSMNGITSPTL